MSERERARARARTPRKRVKLCPRHPRFELPLIPVATWLNLQEQSRAMQCARMQM